MSDRSCLAVILAAGDGTRMKSDRAKVLHSVAHRPMVLHVADALAGAAVDDVALVVGREASRVAAAVTGDAAAASRFSITIHEQHQRLGTAHAVLTAREAIMRGHDDILVVFGDTPLIEPETLMRARAALRDGASVAVIGFRTDKPTGYGRLIVEDGALVAIREEKDASDDERAITLCNGGAMAIDGAQALGLLDAIGNDNSKGEYYLTDIVALVRGEGGRAVAIEAPFEESLGVNTRVELAEAEAVWQHRRRRQMMLGGVGLLAPETVHFAFDTQIDADATVEPNVVFGPGVSVASGATIHAFSHLEGARVGAGASVGPFARLRPGADLGDQSKVGNFCEVKNAALGTGAKVNHLTYIGDATIGARANIGAGTITCNYDGMNKHKTEIGADVFVGSNSALVAPVAIGDGAYIASGSVVTADVSADALVIARAHQVEKPGRAETIRRRNTELKAKRQARIDG